MINADDPEVQAFLAAWHEAGRATAEARSPEMDYDNYYPKTAHQRQKYIALDKGREINRSGVFLLNRATGVVWGIRAYGVRHNGRCKGTLAGFTAKMRAAVQSA